MRSLFAYLILILILGAQGVPVQHTAPRSPELFTQGKDLTGRWRVKLSFSGVEEKHLVLEAQAKGYGKALLLDTGPDGKSVADSQPAVWSETTNARVSFSLEVELPIGTCCREVGTLMLKGKVNSNDTISGRAIFVTSTVEDENPYGFRTMLGSFTATRILN